MGLIVTSTHNIEARQSPGKVKRNLTFSLKIDQIEREHLKDTWGRLLPPDLERQPDTGLGWQYKNHHDNNIQLTSPNDVKESGIATSHSIIYKTDGVDN